MDFCADHKERVKNEGVMMTDIALLKQGMDFLVECAKEEKEIVKKHIYEGEREGGVRDRVAVIERKLATLERDIYKVAIVSGIVCGLIAQGTPEVFRWLLHFIK